MPDLCSSLNTKVSSKISQINFRHILNFRVSAMGNSKSIHENCEDGNEEYVKKYIAAGKDVNARDKVSCALSEIDYCIYI